MRAVIVSFLMAGVAVGAVTTDASAQTRRHHNSYNLASNDVGSLNSLPLTVNRRSWLDPGPVAPSGTGTNYVTANTQFNKDSQQVINPDKFGNDVMQGQPYVPGRSVPVVEFSTTPAGGAYVDNVIGYQNYYFNPAPSVPAANPSPEYGTGFVQ